MSNVNFYELRNRLNPEDIKQILLKYEVKPFHENDKTIIFPTCCHNLSGGSNKLYYYKESRMFKCYTQCEGVFDIFQLLIKMHKLRGADITLFDAIKICNLDNFIANYNTYIRNIQEDINYLYNLLYTKPANVKLPILNPSILNRFIFDKNALKIWEQEDISYNTMVKYGIKYDPIEECIIIPNYDIDNNLISIRGRFVGENAEVKYKPIIYNSKVLSHPSSMSLYGLNINKDQIRNTSQVIIFESEKSVMKMDTIYGWKNVSVATLGQNISNKQIRLLSDLGVQEIILAYDADYRTYEEMDKKRKDYIKIGKTLKNYFNVCILMDLDLNLLNYKDSPIDRGQKVFEKILESRIYI